MPNVVSVNPTENIIEIESFDEVTLDDMLDCIQQAQAIYNQTGIIKVLVLPSKSEELPVPLELAEFSKRIPPHFRVAVVSDAPLDQPSKLQFLRYEATEGGISFQIFPTREAALVYLHSSAT